MKLNSITLGTLNKEYLLYFDVLTNMFNKIFLWLLDFYYHLSFLDCSSTCCTVSFISQLNPINLNNGGV